MTQEDKQLLLKDLCARLPYGVICHTEEGDGYLSSINQTIFGIEYGININPLKRDYFNDSETEEQAIKPYLRPMSSMTDGEETLFRCELPAIAKTDAQLVAMRMELFLKGHLDFNHLIEKGLALEITENNNPY